MRFTTVAEWLTWQNSLNRDEIILGLSRCKEVAHRLNLLTPTFPIISVAGTNGKGSSVTLLSSILKYSGLKVGNHISPHLFRYNERICINQQAITDQQLCEAFAVIDEAREAVALTSFEFITLAAMWFFYQQKIDIAVLEVGLGGRLDAVNTFNADIALITPIGIDHCDYLGDTLEAIAGEKAGICRTEKPTICTDFSIPETIKQHTHSLNSPLYCQEKEFGYQNHDNGATWSWNTKAKSYPNLPLPRLAGDFQLQNASGALMVVQLLQQQGFSISLEHIEQGLQQATIHGRFQSLETQQGLCIFDVAHNPLAAKTLKTNLVQHPCTGKTHAVVGMLKDKDSTQIFDILHSCIDTWHIAPLKSPRSETTETLTQHIPSTAISDYLTIKAAYQAIQAQRTANDRVIIFGSFFTVAEALSAEACFL